ncbi:MAG: tetratricopeptide repeat protein [Cyclobacteriaceae bacterium]|nr:tetratricopeptide repeat protein [Cyclobacteriaceae bacterium]
MRLVLIIYLLQTGTVGFTQTKEDSLYTVIRMQKKDTTELKILLELGDLQDDYDKAIKYYRQALALSLFLQNKKSELLCTVKLLKLNREYNRTDSAFQYGTRATRLANNLNDHNVLAEIHLEVGNVYLTTYSYIHALTEFIEAAKILDSLNNSPRDKMTAYANIGNVQFQLGNYDKAIDYTERGLQIAKEINYDLGVAYCYKTKGRIYRKQEKFDSASGAYEEALKIYTLLNNQYQTCEVLLSLGNLYFDMKLFSKAMKEYEESLSIAKKNDNGLAVYCYAAIGSTLSELQKYPQAIAYFDSTLLLAAGKNPYLEMDSHINLATITERLGNHKQSLFHFKRYAALSDSLNTAENRTVAEEMEAKYQNTAKQNEIELLKKDQELLAQRQKANTVLIILILFSITIISALLINRYRVLNRIKRQAELENMRQNIARDLHDDIGSTLSSINIMSKLAMQQNDNTGHLQKISTYSSRMMETMSDMVWSINPVNDSVAQMLAKMKEFAGEILEPKNIQYEFVYDNSLNEIRLDVEKRKSLFLIFKEAINNIAKYSEATQVFIRLNNVTGILHMQVQDNGNGFDASANTTGNGLKNMAARAQAIKGKWTQLTEPGKGTSICVEIPIT